MAYLLGSSDTSAYTIDSVYDQSQFYIWLGSNASGGIAAASSGNVTKLNLLITSWVTTSIKVCLYEDNALLNSVVVPSSVGSGLVQVAFPSTAVVAGTERYRLGFYKADGVDTITLKAKVGTGNESKRRELAGNYTSPTAVLGAGSFIGTDAFYWSMEDAGDAVVDSYPATVRSGSTGNAYTTTGLTAVTAVSIGTLAATSISDTSGDGTHSVPALSDGDAHELYGTQTVTVTGTEGSPTTSTSFQPATGNDFVTLSGTLNTTETGGLYNFSPAAVVTDQVVFPESDIAYDAQGNITGEAGSYACWHIQASTKIARSYTVILGEDITPPSTPPSIDKRFIMEFISANAKASQALGYQQITDLSAAVGLTIPKGTAYILFKPNAQAIRFRDDGTNPTAGVGYPIAAGAEYIYTGSSPSALRFIEAAASATLDVLYYGVA